MTSSRVNADELDPTGKNWLDRIIKHMKRNPALLPSGVLWNLLINCSSAEVLREICFNEQMNLNIFKFSPSVGYMGRVAGQVLSYLKCLLLFISQYLRWTNPVFINGIKNYPTCHSFRMSKVPTNAAIALLA